MQKVKFSACLLIVLTILFFQVGTADAAPPQQEDAPITGTVQNVVVETDTNNVSTVLVTWLVNGETQTVRLSVDTAAYLTLILVDENGYPILDASGHPTADTTWAGWDIEMDPGMFIPDPVQPPTPPAEEEPQHPIGAKIAEFFSTLFNSVDYDVVMGSHTDGFGFGVITQALWMTEKLDGDATIFQTILDAKKSHDYSMVVLPDGSIPQNWGQLKKALLQGEDDSTLGDVVTNGNGHETAPGQGKGKDDDAERLKDKPEIAPGQTKDKDKDNGSVTAPGQNKDKDKDNNGTPKNPPGQDKDKNKDKEKDNNGNGKTK